MVLSACIKLKKKDQDSSGTAEVSQAQGQSFAETETLTYRYIPDTKGSVTKVVFKAPVDWPANVVLKKTQADKDLELNIEFNENAEWQDALVSESKVSYQFYSLINSELKLLGQAEVIPPLDMAIDEDFNLSQHFSLNEKTQLIYFKNLRIGLKKHLYLENYSGKIFIKNLTSEAGFIQSFPASARAENDVDGKDGGNINFEIINGSGNVTFFMKGENGGHGSLAKSADDFIKGRPGSRGASAKFQAIQSPNPGPYDIITYFNCITPAEPSTNGTKGLTGYNGYSGKSGGNSGMATIKNTSSTLEIFLLSQAGSFGVGSPGGLGGEGGDPGASINSEEDFKIFSKESMTFKLLKNCEPSVAGKKGPPGDPGLPGGNGVSGAQQQSCLFFNGQKIKCIFD